MTNSRYMKAAIAALLAVASGACSANVANLDFKVDKRLVFQAPESRKLVSEPVRLAWTMRDFTIVDPGQGQPSRTAGYFAIFVDRAPVKPGELIRAVAGDDPSCRHIPSCPDVEYLAARGVYTTTQTSFLLPQVRLFGGAKEDVQLHGATIVLLDSSSRRIGESAWVIEFKMRKRGTL